MSDTKEIYCCACERNVEARLTDGAEIYPHRPDLSTLPFWKCDECKNHVGCHHKTENHTQPLGCIPSPELRAARSEIHKMLDPLWMHKGLKRHEVYKHISKEMGWRYHTAQLRTIEEADQVKEIIMDIHHNGLPDEEAA